MEEGVQMGQRAEGRAGQQDPREKASKQTDWILKERG